MNRLNTNDNGVSRWSRLKLRSSNPGRGFTLIELLVVIAIIALLIGILLPSLGEARLAAQNTVSLSNIKSLTQVQILYGGEHDDSFVNPFGRGTNLCNQGTWWRISRNDEQCFAFTDPGVWKSEMYAAHWYSQTADWISPGDYASDVQFAPADAAPKDRFLELSTQYSLDRVIWDTSYFYSPTFWFNPNRYAQSPRNSADPREPDQAGFRRNRQSDVTYPTQKVIIFERFDTSQRRRLETVTILGNPQVLGRRDAPPTWHNPQAKTNVGLVDGSVIRANMSEVSALTQSPKQSVRDAFTPTDVWDVDNSILGRYEMRGDLLENGTTENGGLYPAFFWATKDGIHGRDIQR